MSLEKPSPGGPGKEPVMPPADQETAQRSADVYDLLAWLEVNKKKLLVSAVVLTVIGFVVATMRYMKEQKELEASTALLALKPTVSNPTNTIPPAASAFAKVAQDFSGTSAGERAKLIHATTLFTENKFAEAHTAFSSFLNEHGDSPWAGTARYGIAAALEAQGKMNEAVAGYQAVTTADANSAVADDAKMALARIYEDRKQPEQALRLYNELAPMQGGMMGSMGGMGGRYEANMRREALYKLHPHLNTNRPSSQFMPNMQPAVGTNRTLTVGPSNAAAATLPTNSLGTPTLTPPTNAVPPAN